MQAARFTVRNKTAMLFGKGFNWLPGAVRRS
jgi:hypothetical protein